MSENNLRFDDVRMIHHLHNLVFTFDKVEDLRYILRFDHFLYGNLRRIFFEGALKNFRILTCSTLCLKPVVVLQPLLTLRTASATKGVEKKKKIRAEDVSKPLSFQPLHHEMVFTPSLHTHPMAVVIDSSHALYSSTLG